ncbi:hypothetical protein JTB14_020242 [Gonioctena quinquepunctata]|nr:hypothetical protein JTB14_020242 [Gonioctena quinquepunctata]
MDCVRTFVLCIMLSVFYSVKCECPRIIYREEWNASLPSSTRNLTLSPPPYMVVHHSATRSCEEEEECKTLVKSIQRYHMIDRHWEDIGYNFLIGGDGNIYEGRGWGIHGAHVINYNARSIGVCLLGNYESNEPPDLQLQALKDFIDCALDVEGIEEEYQLIGHRQGSPTLCPGGSYLELLKNGLIS